MTTMTIHALEPEIEKRIRRKSRKERKSLNQTLKELLSESVGCASPSRPDHRNDFAEFSGVWSGEDQQEFNTVTADFGRIDEEEWQ